MRTLVKGVDAEWNSEIQAKWESLAKNDPLTADFYKGVVTADYQRNNRFADHLTEIFVAEDAAGNQYVLVLYNGPISDYDSSRKI